MNEQIERTEGAIEKDAELPWMPKLTIAERWPDGRPIPDWMPTMLRAFAYSAQQLRSPQTQTTEDRSSEDKIPTL
jgi:hypothetical protein